ncbi:MAG: hypothetical protein ABUT20_37695 [Bacteroidota bacterium]
MKKLIQKNNVKRFAIAITTLFTFMIISANSVAAQGKQDPNEENYSVKYIGTSETGLVFHVTYDNSEANRFEVILKNQDGVVFFDKFFSDQKFDTKIVLTNGADSDNLSFIIKSGKKDLVQKFNIQTRTVQVTDVQVAK